MVTQEMIQSRPPLQLESKLPLKEYVDAEDFKGQTSDAAAICSATPFGSTLFSRKLCISRPFSSPVLSRLSLLSVMEKNMVVGLRE